MSLEKVFKRISEYLKYEETYVVNKNQMDLITTCYSYGIVNSDQLQKILEKQLNEVKNERSLEEI